MDQNPRAGDRYFGGPSNNLQYSAIPRGKTGGNDTVGPNDPMFHQPMNNRDNLPDNNRGPTLPRDARPPGAAFDPVTPLPDQPAGPDFDGLPPGMA